DLDTGNDSEHSRLDLLTQDPSPFAPSTRTNPTRRRVTIPSRSGRNATVRRSAPGGGDGRTVGAAGSGEIDQVFACDPLPRLHEQQPLGRFPSRSQLLERVGVV